MKKTFALSILTISSSFAVAQPIVGISYLRIGMVESEFLELPEIKEKNLQDFADFKGVTLDADIWRQTNETPNSIAGSRIYLPDYVEYKFKMERSILSSGAGDSYGITAIFYKKELIKLELKTAPSTAEFIDVLTEKYGKPIIVDKMKKEVCQNNFGGKSMHNSGEFSWSWRGKGPVKAMVRINQFGCGKYVASSYTVEDAKKIELAYKLEREAEINNKKTEAKTKAAASTL